MIVGLRGVVLVKEPTKVHLDVNGVVYEVFVSLQTSMVLGSDEVFLHTTHIVREDAQLLYGFAEKEEREMFNLLISVSGIGPNTAMIMLSSLIPEEIAAAIQGEDVKTIQSVKGIGAKTAQRVIVDLKDKMLKFEFSTENVILQNNTERNDALTALISLGFDRKAAGRDSFRRKALWAKSQLSGGPSAQKIQC